MSRAHILPPNASALMRAVDKATPQWDALAGALRGPLWGHPQQLAPWLAAEWALSPLARYFADTAALIAAGQPWLLERGTQRAVHRALGWIGFASARCVEDGPYLHIRFEREPLPQQLPAIVHLVTASVPAHVRVWRIFGGDDPRVLRLDYGPALDAGVLDNDGGVWLPTYPPILGHFVQRHAGHAPAFVPGQPLAVHTHARLGRHIHDDSLTLDSWRLDSRILIDAFGGIGQLDSRTCAAPPRLQPLGSAAQVHHTRRASATAAAGQPLDARQSRRALAAPSLLPAPRCWCGPWRGTWRPQGVAGRHTQHP